MVGLILAFIFFTPRALFRDQPKASSVVMLPPDRGTNPYWIEPELLSGVPDADRVARATALVKERSVGKKLSVVRLEPIFDAEREIKGYMAYTTP
jgi:hypothetical protein